MPILGVVVVAAAGFLEGLRDVRGRAGVQTLTRVCDVSAAIEQLSALSALGRYPPASLDQLGNLIGEDLPLGNDLNAGIEAAFVALHLKGHTVRLDLPDRAIGNTDRDELDPNPTRLDTPERWEILDAWGNPLAYFVAGDKGYRGVRAKIVMATGEVATARPWKRRAGTYVNPRSFQLVSAGPDAVFNTEDDIGNFALFPVAAE